MKTSAAKLGTLVLAALLGGTALTGCTSKGTAAASGTGAGAVSSATGAPAPSASGPTASDAGQGSATQDSTTTTAPATKPKTAPKTSAPPLLPASFPTTGSNDVQTLLDPLTALEASDVNTPIRFQRELDPSTTWNALRTWVLAPYSPDLIDYDQTAYGLHGETRPYMDVAIASPKIVPSNHYPDFIGGIMAAAGATEDLYTPPSYNSHLAGYSVTIDCAHETLKGRTVCVWAGATPGGGHVPFVGVVVILSTVPTDKAAAVAAYVASELTA